jgi:23S rRNA (cytidine1920-2'-O)/16S rRNA (cytidine1409-2'-O)-methyltransferase
MKAKTAKKRLDALLVERGLADSLQKAQAMILAGEVHVDGTRAEKAGAQFGQEAAIGIASRAQKYASRGGFKLEGALADFSVDVAGKTCLDVGASTGGFSDCLLQHGAARVYAVDVTVNQLDWKVRNDVRVIAVERNARGLRNDDIPEPIDLVVIDVSFISATKVLAPAAACTRPGADLLILVKPQFELPKKDVTSGGIVKDDRLHQKAIDTVRQAATRFELDILGVHTSRLPGAEGNQEFFVHARKKL